MSVRVTQRLEESLQAVCPVAGVSVGTPGNVTTVRIDYAAEATSLEREAAQAALAAFDWSAAAQIAWENARTQARTDLIAAAAQATDALDTYLAISNPTNAQAVAFTRKSAVMLKQIIKRLVQLS